MEKVKYTHLAKIYGFRCWFNDQTMELKGTNWVNDKMIDLFIWLEHIYPINDHFQIQLIEIINDNQIINRANKELFKNR